MNFNKFINSDYLKENPLYGIDTYKDELNLATGVCMRKIRKLVFDGTENWRESSDTNIYIALSPNQGVAWTHVLSTHFTPSQIQTNGGLLWFVNANVDFDTVEECKSYLAQQYTNGTPVTVWYVLATPTTETITVPSGLSGTEEGYLNQSGTPTPTNPIYPTANTVEKWFDLNHYIMGTSTDTITNLPADIYPNDTTATVGLKGNTVQSTTPTPQNPVMPQECGERTGNLFDDTTATLGKYMDNNGNEQTSSATLPTQQLNHSDYFPVLPNSVYTFSSVKDSSVQQTVAFVWYTSEKSFMSRTTEVKTVGTTSYSLTATAPNNAGYAIINYTTANNEVMLNTGSTALPYEPYGIKIPISSASTTTNAYLGEVQSTRKIKKHELTGTESVYVYANSDICFYIYHDYMASNQRTNGFCTHFPTQYSPAYSDNTAVTFGAYDKNIYFNFSAEMAAALGIVSQDKESFKTWLAQQYAAGTPVTVWYVLATPETAVLNESLMKIGEYADEVSNISIPVTAGGDTISVDTTLQPSEVIVNYKGWHPVQSAHEKSRNLFDKSTAAVGYGVDDNSGNLFRSAALSASDYINISGESYVRATYITSGVANQYGAFYDENKTYISGYSDYSNAIAVPQNAVYTRITARTEYIDEFMLNAGSSALPYEPYWK